MSASAPIRVVLAKVGLDGHDRGIKVVARALRDAGMQVIYAGLWQTPEAVVRTAGDEDADWLGLSLLSGAHMTLVPRVIELLKQAGLEHVGILVGGIIPETDVPKLMALGVAQSSVLEPRYLKSSSSCKRTRAVRSRAMLETLVNRFRQGDRLALSRLLSYIARGEHIGDILAQTMPATKKSLVVAITGSAGVGKSTLVGKLLQSIRASGRTVAVLACDPQSPLSGGALLGDRFRMTSQPDDDGVFIRSLAAAGGQGALAEHLDAMIRLLELFSFEVLLLETVGAGQGDTAVRELVDVVVLLLQPETGDDLQWEKAGVLEVADVLVLHKADLPGAENVEAQIKAALMLSSHEMPPVLRVSSRSGAGIDELWEMIARSPHRRKQVNEGEELLRLTQRILKQRFASRSGDDAVRQLIEQWHRGAFDTETAIYRLCQMLLVQGNGDSNDAPP